MPALAAFLRGIFQNQLAFLGDMFDRKVALRLAWIGLAVALLAAFFAGVNALFAGITAAMPTFLTTAASWIMPTNFDECVAAYFTALTLRFAFEWKYQITKSASGGF